jgi:hypothetical protein
VDEVGGLLASVPLLNDDLLKRRRLRRIFILKVRDL